jgi:hypothetical protein
LHISRGSFPVGERDLTAMLSEWGVVTVGDFVIC